MVEPLQGRAGKAYERPLLGGMTFELAGVSE